MSADPSPSRHESASLTEPSRQPEAALQYDTDAAVMRAACELAARGIGRVEPNPPVGAIVVDAERRVLGRGWHQQYGGPHAEVFALAEAGAAAEGATLFVTLEPCCHFGKTPPCSRAVIAAGIRRVVIAKSDPAAHVNGGGIAELQQAGIAVEVGLLANVAARLTAPFIKLMTRGLPWVHAKWAMTLDGKLASRSGHSQWISGSESRRIVHELRGRMDGIVVGIGTALADDPQLTARPPGLRTACRIVIDSQARLPVSSRLVQTAREQPVLCVVGDRAPADRLAALRAAGVEVLVSATDDNGQVRISDWLAELGRRRLTHLLVEGGGRLLGALFDAAAVDEVHAFIAPKIVGGANAVSPVMGAGLARIPESLLHEREVQLLGDDVYLHGFLRRSCESP